MSEQTTDFQCHAPQCRRQAAEKDVLIEELEFDIQTLRADNQNLTREHSARDGRWVKFVQVLMFIGGIVLTYYFLDSFPSGQGPLDR